MSDKEVFKKMAVKSEDVTKSEFVPEKSVYITDMVQGITDKDLFSVVTQGILTRPLIRMQVSEVLSCVVVNTKDKNGKVLTDKDGNVCTHEEFKYPTNVIHSALTNAIVKSLVLEMNKIRTNTMRFITLQGCICLCKVDTTEEREAGKNFTRYDIPEKPFLHSDGIINGLKYTFINFTVDNGVLSKETVVGLRGIELADMIISAVGIHKFKDAIGSSTTNAGLLTDRMKAYIRDYKKSSNRSITRTIKALEDDLKNKVEDRASDADYLADIKEVAKQLKNDMKAEKLIENTRSKSLLPNIETELMARFNRIVENTKDEETEEEN